MALTTAFMERACLAGAILHTVEARLLVDDGRVIGVSTPRGNVRADKVVVCSGPVPDEVLGAVGVTVPVGPVWGVIAETCLPHAPRHVLLEASAFLAALAEKEQPADVDHTQAEGIGFGMVTQGTVSALGHSLSPQRPDPAVIAPQLVAKASTYVPAIERVPIRSTRVAARPTSRDDLPVLGAIPGHANCYVALGHGGKGITIGPGTAKLLVDAMHGEAAIPPEMDVRRFLEIGE